MLLAPTCVTTVCNQTMTTDLPTNRVVEANSSTMKGLVPLLLIAAITTPASAQIFGGYGFGSGSSQRSAPETLPGPNGAWRGLSFTSYNGECPVGTRREVMMVREGKYVETKKWPYQEWVSKKWKTTVCKTLNMRHDYIPASNGSCWEGSTYAGNGYCRANPDVAYPILPKNGKCPKGTELTTFSGKTYCATVLGHTGQQYDSVSVDVVTKAKF